MPETKVYRTAIVLSFRTENVSQKAMEKVLRERLVELGFDVETLFTAKVS